MAINRENPDVGFKLDGYLINDIGAAIMRLTSTQPFLMGPQAMYGRLTVQSVTRKPKDGDVHIYTLRMGFLRLRQMPNAISECELNYGMKEEIECQILKGLCTQTENWSRECF